MLEKCTNHSFLENVVNSNVFGTISKNVRKDFLEEDIVVLDSTNGRCEKCSAKVYSIPKHYINHNKLYLSNTR